MQYKFFYKIRVFISLFFLLSVALVSAQAKNSLCDGMGEVNYGYNYSPELLPIINKEISLEPNNPELYLRRASVNIFLKNYKDVSEDIKKVIFSNPDNDGLIYQGARQLCLIGQYEESIRLGDYLLSKNADNALGYIIRYPNKFQLGDYKGAAEDLFKSPVINAAIESGILSKLLYELRNDPKIEDYFKKLFEYLEKQREGPGGTGSFYDYRRNWIAIYTDYAIFYKETRAVAETSALFDKYAKDFSLAGRAEIYQKLGEYEAAIADLTKFLETTEDKSYYLLKRGDVYVLNKQFDKAIADYEMIKKLDEDERIQKTTIDRIREAKQKQIEDFKQAK